MPEVTQILSRIEAGDPSAAEQLLPLLYDELKKLAAHRLAHEKPGQTLQATALVHEAYLRLVVGNESQHWNGRGHFSPRLPKPCGESSLKKPAASIACGMVANCDALNLTANSTSPARKTRT